jgi:hypothetical protein
VVALYLKQLTFSWQTNSSGIESGLEEAITQRNVANARRLLVFHNYFIDENKKINFVAFLQAVRAQNGVLGTGNSE